MSQQDQPEENSSSPPPTPAGPPPVPPGPPPQAQLSSETDATGGLIPYKNSASLVSYYLGIFSLIPILGLLLGILAIGFGVAGWRNYRRNPAARGQVHCWIGIVLGTLVVLGHLIAIGMMFAAVRWR